MAARGPEGGSPERGGAFRRRLPNVIVLDEELAVIMHSATDVWRTLDLAVTIGQPLPGPLGELVRAATRSWGREAPKEATVLFPWPAVAVIIYGLVSSDGHRVCVCGERFSPRRDLSWAERAFGLSPRESQILRYVLRGEATPQIAVRLHIAESTVVAHIKSLLLKTKAANRAALVAKVLGWETAPD